MRRVIFAALAGAWLASTAGQALSHRSSTYNESSISSIGEIKLWLVNKYSNTTTYELQVLDRDTFLPIDENLWRSNYENDLIVLDPEEVSTGIVVRVKNPGKYYVCTIVAKVPENSIGLRSQICLRLWYK